MEISSVLITGAAGDIGLGMSKILKDISWVNKVYGADINNNIPYDHFYFDFFQLPSVYNSDYITFLKVLIKKHQIELIIPTSEVEIRYFNEKSIKQIEGIPLLIPSFEVMEIGFDKWKTVKYLEEKGYSFPWTNIVKGGSPRDIPCIVKKRSGSGSKDINIITEDNLEYYKSKNEEWIFQELLLPASEEYTSCIFKSKSKEVNIISFRRTLKGGRTGYAEVIENPIINDFLNTFAKELDFQGSINIQFRLTDRGPVIFEINPRFSSTLVFRHKLGFKDVEWSILDKFETLNTIKFCNSDNVGKRIFRSDNEIIY